MKPIFLFSVLMLTGCASNLAVTPPEPVIGIPVTAFCGNSTSGDSFTGTGSTYNLFLANGNEVKGQTVAQARGFILP